MKNKYIDFLIKSPARFGHLVGFTKLTELHNDWIREMILSKEDETLQAHRGSYKTTCASIALADICVVFPNLTTMFMRKTDGDTKEVIRQVQKILQDPHMQYISKQIYGVPVRLTSSSATAINTNLVNSVKGTYQVLGMGLGSSLTGKHFDRIFTDDIVNVNDRISQAERDRTKLIYQELQNIKNRGGRIFNTGTPWHKEDCFTLMPNPKKWDCYSSGLMSEEEIDDVRRKMTSSLFAANYELKHIAGDDVIFDNPRINASISLVENGVCHIDASYGGSDGTAFTICARHDGNYYIFGKLWKGKHVDNCLDEIISLKDGLNAGRIYCENNGDKGYLAKELRRRGQLVSTYHESTNKFIKITSYLKFEWEKVYFVEGTDKEYIEEICDYTEDAEHDDAPDSLASMIRKHWRKDDGHTGYYHSILN